MGKKKLAKKFGSIKILPYLCTRKTKNRGVAQLV